MDWPETPDDCHIGSVGPIATHDGKMCQIQAIVIYTKLGVEVGKRPLIISPGLLDAYSVVPEKLQQLWDSIPEVPQSVKDAVRNQLPDKVFIDIWKG